MPERANKCDIREAELVDIAVSMKKRAYAPYSGYTVGAALLCADGSVYTGCNIENASYTPTVCAERTAIFKAVSEGKRDFIAIAVAGGKDMSVEDAFPPCGVWRQFRVECCNREDFKILVATSEGFESYTLGELLPHGFSPKNIKR